MVQLVHSVAPEAIYNAEYPYFSSVSPALAAHFKSSADHIIESKSIGTGCDVIEAASNDGHLLTHFKAAIVDANEHKHGLYMGENGLMIHAPDRAQSLVDKYDIRNKHVIEIGCGKADFLQLLCTLADNQGTGID